MDRLEKAFELMKKGHRVNEIAQSLNLSPEETEILLLSGKIKEISVPDFSKKDKKKIWNEISKQFSTRKALSFKARLVLGLASLLIVSTTVIGAASVNSLPDSPLYNLKTAYLKLVEKVAYGSSYHKKLIKRQIMEYGMALKSHQEKKDYEAIKAIKQKLEKSKRSLKLLEKAKTRRGMPPLKDNRLKRPVNKKIPKIHKPSTTQTPENNLNNRPAGNEEKELNFRNKKQTGNSNNKF